jgi:dTDP-4-dehydrorhamnose 3,5-epimerase
MEFTPTALPDVMVITSPVYQDSRGEFLETYRLAEFAQAGINLPFIQDNHAGSHQGVLRGLHYQIQQAQGKLVRVISGVVYDVAVDLRRSSPHFGKFIGVTLSAIEKNQLWIPAGFAHGYYVMSEWAEVSYKVTDYYAPRWERTLLWNDPALGIDWPLVDGAAPLLSDNDRQGIPLADAETYQ